MAGSKVYVKKPIRRYERAFEAKPEGAEQPVDSEGNAVVLTDITSTQPAPGSPISVKASAVRRSKVHLDNDSKPEQCEEDGD